MFASIGLRNPDGLETAGEDLPCVLSGFGVLEEVTIVSRRTRAGH